MINFFQNVCRSSSRRRRFGLCDDAPPIQKPAYIAENQGQHWIATVVNDYEEKVDFYAIDHCVSVTPRPDGKNAKRCDGVLVMDDIIAFVELKSRKHKGPEWVAEAVEQLQETIHKYENEGSELPFQTKRAYSANGMRPYSRRGQGERIERFYNDCRYVLYVQATINLRSAEG